MNVRKMNWLASMALAWLVFACSSHGAESQPSYNFQELFSLIRSNLAGLSPEDLNRAATLGLVDQLRGRVELIGGAGDTNVVRDQPIARTNIFDESFGYIRIGAVSEGLGVQFGNTLEQMGAAKSLKGIILDLRFAAGTDFSAAVDVVDYFAATEQVLLKWGGKTGRTKPKLNPVKTPMAVLINHQTIGAAEALAGMLRVASLAYLVGTPTAGQARTYQEFTLSNGQKLRIGQGPVELGTGEIISDKGVAPDLFVESNAAAERNYIIDPFSAVSEPITNVNTQTPKDKSTTVRVTRKNFNEADLVRRHKEGLDPDSPLATGSDEPEHTKTAIVDPSLGRALDFLKGLSILQAKPN